MLYLPVNYSDRNLIVNHNFCRDTLASTSVKAVPGLLLAWPEFDATGKFANTLPDTGEVSPHMMTPVSY
jgi:hypothetical protein